MSPEPTIVPRLAVTPGEPSGIGPDLCVMIAQRHHNADLVIVADPKLIEDRAERLGLPLKLVPYRPDAMPHAQKPGQLRILPVALSANCRPGRLDTTNAHYVLETLRRAGQGCLAGEFDAVVTAPVHKGVINEAGIPFTGHTEFLANLTGAARPVMMLAAGSLRVALATTHLPLKEVPASITFNSLMQVLEILASDLETKFGIAGPRILVCGLNPHAGEGGHLGREEIDIIEPVVRSLQSRGMSLIGPLPADTAFTPRHLANADAVLAMYHDQGLPVLKFAGFGHAVNITLGLPIVRTSVDHGTALELAGTGEAQDGSLEAALVMARDLASLAKRTSADPVP